MYFFLVKTYKYLGKGMIFLGGNYEEDKSDPFFGLLDNRTQKAQ